MVLSLIRFSSSCAGGFFSNILIVNTWWWPFAAETCCIFEKNWPERQWTYNLTLRRANETVVVEKQQLSHFSVCERTQACEWVRGRVRSRWSLSYPARNVHAPYCHLWPLWPHHILWHCLVNDTIFGKSYWSLNVCFDSHYKVYLEHFRF
jgi:hypothetical protein